MMLKNYIVGMLLCIGVISNAQKGIVISEVAKKNNWTLSDYGHKVLALGKNQKNVLVSVVEKDGLDILENVPYYKKSHLLLIDVETHKIIWKKDIPAVSYFKNLGNGKVAIATINQNQFNNKKNNFYGDEVLMIFDIKTGKKLSEILLKGISRRSNIFGILEDKNGNYFVYYPERYYEEKAPEGNGERGVLVKYNQRGKKAWSFTLGKGFVSSGLIALSKNNQILFFTEGMNIPYEYRSHIPGRFSGKSVLGIISQEGRLKKMVPVFESRRILRNKMCMYFLKDVNGTIKLGTTFERTLVKSLTPDISHKGIQILSFTKNLRIDSADYIDGFYDRIVKTKLNGNKVLIYGKPDGLLKNKFGTLNVNENWERVILNYNLEDGTFKFHKSPYRSYRPNFELNGDKIVPRFKTSFNTLALLAYDLNEWQSGKLHAGSQYSTSNWDDLMQFRPLKDGILTVQKSLGVVKGNGSWKELIKYDTQGKTIWKVGLNNMVTAYIITNKGETLLTTSQNYRSYKLSFVDEFGKTKWNKEIPRPSSKSLQNENKNLVVFYYPKYNRRDTVYKKIQGIKIIDKSGKQLNEATIETQKKSSGSFLKWFSNSNGQVYGIFKTSGTIKIKNNKINISAGNESFYYFLKLDSKGNLAEKPVLKLKEYSVNYSNKFLLLNNEGYTKINRSKESGKNGAVYKIKTINKKGKELWENSFEAYKILSIKEHNGAVYVASFIKGNNHTSRNKQYYHLKVEKFSLKKGKQSTLIKMDQNISDGGSEGKPLWSIEDGKLVFHIGVRYNIKAQFKSETYYSKGSKDFTIFKMILD